MYERRHFFEDDCERLPTSLKVKPEVLVNAHEAFEHILLCEVLIVRTRWITFRHREVSDPENGDSGEPWQER